VNSGKGDVAYYLPIYERILCLIYGFSRKTDSSRYGIDDHASTAQRICMRSGLCYFLDEDD